MGSRSSPPTQGSELTFRTTAAWLGLATPPCLRPWSQYGRGSEFVAFDYRRGSLKRSGLVTL